MKRRLLASDFAERLEAEIPLRQRSALADLRDELLASTDGSAPEGLSAQFIATLRWTEQQFAAIAQLHEKAAAFELRLLNATREADRAAAILDLAERLGAGPAQVDRDRKALERYFDADAVLERYRRRVGERERALAYGLTRIGELAAAGLAQGDLANDAPEIAEELAKLLVAGRSWRGDGRVRQAAHRAFRSMAETAGAKLGGFWLDVALRDTRRTALNPLEDVWAQVDALTSLLVLSPVSFDAVLRRRIGPQADLQTPLARDNRLFLRRALAPMLAKSVHGHPRHLEFLQRLANDNDGAVRQALAGALPELPEAHRAGFFAKLRVDADPQVRAALAVQTTRIAAIWGAIPCIDYLERLLARERDEFVLRLGISATVDLVEWCLANEPGHAVVAAERLRQALTGLRGRSEDAKILRWAGMAREELWLRSDPEARALAGAIGERLSGWREGKARRLRLSDADPETLGRVLAALATRDFGFDLKPGRRMRLRRGDRFARRWWRIFHELRTSATDKRQAWLHTIGRRFEGPIIAPSAHMAELAPTKVPGEPLHLGSEAGWRNYLPLLDHALSALDRGVAFEIYTSEGVTRLVPPRGLMARIKGFAGLSWRFPAIAPLRNQGGNDYVTALRQVGLAVEFTPRLEPGEVADPQVTKLFGFGAALPAFAVFVRDAWAYFATVYENSLLHLSVFIALASLWFAGRHIWHGRRMRRNRNAIALVLGGWGTRGKSGTERLKAGLINALGHPLVSKTTGCEAMFLLGRSFGDLQEMFLFRPYDKATIWEQSDLVRTARGLGARVFLWECMGLTPSYVRVLQRDWMRDDLSTITNTYPDHEDVQGPAGRNIPEVMTQFIPERGTLLTTEEEMYPILREGAEQVGTRIRPVGWKQAGLIHQSLLNRFPYAEHPFNIALVTAMADELGIAPDFAVKEMSDRVVADLGVLKIYPRSVVDDRTLEFVMGNSANERFGAMGNWTRMGFFEHALDKDPEIFISTVVNNRADRVPRSRVFARILVEDIAADQHVLIGSNIDGLLGFIEESWQEYAEKISLFGQEASPTETLAALARQQRVPLDQAQLGGRIAAMLKGVGAGLTGEEAMAALEAGRLPAALEAANVPHAETIAGHADEWRARCDEYAALAAKAASGSDQAALDGAVRDFLRKCFMAKLVPVREFYTPGEEIIRMIARITPPGLINRIMGMQNIKGTGLDFVYRWQAWESCHKACQQARDADPGVARRGFDLLSSFQEYGALSDRHVRATLAALREAGGGAVGAGEAQLDAILARLDTQMAAFETKGEGATGGSSGGSRFLEAAEAFFDSTDAILRRRAADRIYRELIAEQISSQRAALELKKLTSRQKGGWLAPALAGLTDRARSLTSRRRANDYNSKD